MRDVCQVSPHAVVAVAGAVADADAVPGDVPQTRAWNRDANNLASKLTSYLLKTTPHLRPPALVAWPSLARPRAQS